MTDAVFEGNTNATGRNLVVDNDLVFIVDMDSAVKTLETREGLFFILCLEGEMHVKYEHTAYTLRQHDLLIFRSNDIKKFSMTQSDDSNYFSMFSSQVLLYSFYPDHDIRFEISLLSGFHNHKLDDATSDIIYSHKLLVDQIWDGALSVEYRNKVLRIQAISIFRVIQGALAGAVNVMQKKRIVSQPSRLFVQFTELLSAETNKRRPLEYYANLLYISPKYLSAVCRKVAGVSAYKIILDASIADVKFALRNTDIAISELSEQFGFSSISFFGQFVKKYTGMSPREYRRGDDAE